MAERAIRFAVRSSTALARLLRPGAVVVLIVVSLYAAGALLRELDVPSASFWATERWAKVALAIVGVFAFAGYLLVVLGYRRSLRRSDSDRQLYAACRDIASAVVRDTSLDQESVAAHVWKVRGVPGARRLERRATFVPWERPPTPLVWAKGKGVIGVCWENGDWVLADLEAIQAAAPNEAAFTDLPEDDQFGFTWAEFRSTEHYKAVLAWPLFGGPEAAPSVVGCLSVDVQQAGAAEELERYKNGDRAGFLAHVALCETVLRHE